MSRYTLARRGENTQQGQSTFANKLFLQGIHEPIWSYCLEEKVWQRQFAKFIDGLDRLFSVLGTKIRDRCPIPQAPKPSDKFTIDFQKLAAAALGDHTFCEPMVLQNVSFDNCSDLKSD